jgi:hypothetical protein
MAVKTNMASYKTLPWNYGAPLKTCSHSYTVPNAQNGKVSTCVQHPMWCWAVSKLLLQWVVHKQKSIYSLYCWSLCVSDTLFQIMRILNYEQSSHPEQKQYNWMRCFPLILQRQWNGLGQYILFSLVKMCKTCRSTTSYPHSCIFWASATSERASLPGAYET